MEVDAFAKLNFTFEVLGRRDDGFHEIKTIMQTIDLADHLHVEVADSLSVGCDYPELTGDSNLIWRAATNLARDIVKKIEADLVFPGQIKVTVIRESRSVEYARYHILDRIEQKV